MANVILAAGGTGGHIFPALAVAEILSAAGHQVTLFTDRRGAPMVEGKISYRLIESASPFNAGIAAKLAGLARLGIGFVQSLGAMLWRRPKAVIGFGGYPSFAPIVSGRLLGAICVLHEQNAIMGRANRLLGKYAHHIALSFADTTGAPGADKARLTGLPVRSAFAAIAPYRPKSTMKSDKVAWQITIIGGSLGAQIFADIIPAAIALLPQHIRDQIHITQQARDAHIAPLKQAYDALGISFDVSRFYHDIPSLFAASDIIISRAGASSVQEIATAGRAAILVPFAAAMDDHQTGNAMRLVTSGGGQMITEADATPDRLASDLLALIEDSKTRQKMAQSASALAHENAALAIAQLTGLDLKAAHIGATQ